MGIVARAGLLAGLVLSLAACGQPVAPVTVSPVSPPALVASPTGTIASSAASTAQASASSTSFPPGTATQTAASPAVTAAPGGTAARFDGKRAFEDLRAQMRWVPRDTGTEGWKQTGDYIIAQLRAAGWPVEEQHFTVKGIVARNMIARRGHGPSIIIGAHYDSRRRADQDPDPGKRQQPVPAANDGGSGVAVLLELARVLQPELLNHEISLAFFDAEDDGELDGWNWGEGSRYMAEHLTVRPVAVVVLDMIGDADLRIPYEQNSTPSLRESIWSTAAALGYKQFVPQLGYAMTDDHTAFLEKGYPAVDIIDFDYPPWHTTSDTLDKVSAESLAAVGTTIQVWLTNGKEP